MNKISLKEKIKWTLYYYNHHPKGRFERLHYLQLLVVLSGVTIILEAVLYLCLNE